MANGVDATLGCLYMVLSLICFGLIGIFIKFAETRGCKPSALSTLAYGWSLLFALLLILSRGAHFEVPGVVYLIAVPFGAVGAIGVIVFMVGVRYGKISTSWLVINLSAAVPAIGSVMLYHEPVKMKKFAVLALAIASVLLLWKDKQDDEAKRAATVIPAQENL